jgi:hypothetical protein
LNIRFVDGVIQESAPEALFQFASRWTVSSSQLVFSRDVYERHNGFDLIAPILSDADAILRWMIDADRILYPDPLSLRRRWAGFSHCTDARFIRNGRHDEVLGEERFATCDSPENAHRRATFEA